MASAHEREKIVHLTPLSAFTGSFAVTRSIALGAVQETLLMPLYARALETRRPTAVFRDYHAASVVGHLAYDFAKFNDLAVHAAAVLRTAIFDDLVRSFIAVHPDGVVTDVGAGLNARFERLDNGRARWLEIDLPDSMDLRRRFFAEHPRRHMQALSMLDPAWTSAARQLGRDQMVTAEGVLPYLQPHEVKRTLALVAEHLRGAVVAFDTVAPSTADRAGGQGVPGTRARIRWLCADPRVGGGMGHGLSLAGSKRSPICRLPCSVGCRRATAIGWRWPRCYPSLGLSDYRINVCFCRRAPPGAVDGVRC